VHPCVIGPHVDLQPDLAAVLAERVAPAPPPPAEGLGAAQQPVHARGAHAQHLGGGGIVDAPVAAKALDVRRDDGAQQLPAGHPRQPPRLCQQPRRLG